MASEFNADDILEVSTSGSTSGLTCSPTSALKFAPNSDYHFGIKLPLVHI